MADKPQHTLINPICGMHLLPHEVAATYIFFGRTYGFCSHECHELFAHVPERYIVHLAHAREQSWGHRCPLQRNAPT